MATTTAWIRVATPNLRLAFSTWKFTVLSEMLRSRAIAQSDLPAATQLKISLSRGVTRGRGPGHPHRPFPRAIFSPAPQHNVGEKMRESPKQNANIGEASFCTRTDVGEYHPQYQSSARVFRLDRIWGALDVPRGDTLSAADRVRGLRDRHQRFHPKRLGQRPAGSDLHPHLPGV